MNRLILTCFSPFCPPWAWTVPGLREFGYYRNPILQKCLFLLNTKRRVWEMSSCCAKKKKWGTRVQHSNKTLPSLALLKYWGTLGTTKQTVPLGQFCWPWLVIRVDSIIYHSIKTVVFFIPERVRMPLSSTTFCGFPLFKAKTQNIFGGPHVFSG